MKKSWIRLVRRTIVQRAGGVILKIVQTGDPVLRRTARLLSPEEVRGVRIQQLASDRRDTTRDAPGARTFPREVWIQEPPLNWPTRKPLIYEINTWVWLDDLSRRYQGPLTLRSVPPQEWDAIGSLGIDAVWLMGVWERSPAGIRIARQMPGLQGLYRQVVPDYTDQDVVGSPYSVHRYVVDERLGGLHGLQHARSALAAHNIGLILDFVPNHVARDHPWIQEHAEYFICGDLADLRRDPDGYFQAGDNIIACGKDPYFPPWTDTAQLNAFNPPLREAAVDVLRDLTHLCDGVRCDMAMLMISRIFAGTWGIRAGPAPASEYWQELIQAVRAFSSGFLFLGEAYWDLEWELMQQGFDFCYDKRLYDRLVHGEAESVRLHLQADVSYQQKLVRFIENHDERRAADAFAPRKLQAAALTISTVPGATLFHEGQFEGRRLRLPIQLGRHPHEEVDGELAAFYRKLLQASGSLDLREGRWQLCELSGWPDNSTFRNIVAWCWETPAARLLVAVNFSDGSSQACVRVPWESLAGRTLRLTDVLSGAVYDRNGDQLSESGLFVDLQPWGYHFMMEAR